MNFSQARHVIQLGDISAPETLEAAIAKMESGTDAESAYWAGYGLYHFSESIRVGARPLFYLRRAADLDPSRLKYRYLLMCALFESGEWTDASREAEWVVAHSAVDDWRTVEAHLAAAQILVVVGGAPTVNEDHVERVLRLWEAADERFGEAAGCEILERPWQIDRYCRAGLSPRLRQMLDNLLEW